jgi:small-conductance mechanosensitive channel
MVQWILPLAFICGGLLAGIVFERFVFEKMKTFAANNQLPGNEIFFTSLHRLTAVWFVVAGFFAAMLSHPMSTAVSNVADKILLIVFLYSVTLFFARLISGFVGVFGQRTQVISVSLISNLAKISIFIIGILIILQTLGIQIAPILTTLGIGGIAVALALQDTLSNLFSGLYLIFSRQIRTGNYLKLDGGYEGYVTDITWRNTTIKELSNNIIVVPNSKLASAIFTNYHLPVKDMTVTIKLGVDYTSDLEKVERVTIKVAQEVMQAVAPEITDFEPYMRYHTFGDFSIDFTVYLRVNEFFDQRIAKHEFVKRLHKCYQQEGINIPAPERTVCRQLRPGES